MEIILTLRGVGASYDKKTVFSGIDLDIPKNQIVSIIGPSGCGKSTLLRSIDRMTEEEVGGKVEGEICLNGVPVSQMPTEELRRHIGMVFQTPTPFPFSIEKNLTFALSYYGVRDKKEQQRILTEKLKMTGLYDEVKDHLGRNARKLSGGQQQRLCIARALTVEPDILMLDEPCSALDVKSTAIIEEMLVSLKERYTILMVTHNLSQAKRISDQVVFLDQGRLIETADRDTFFNSPQNEETKDFLNGMA